MARKKGTNQNLKILGLIILAVLVASYVISGDVTTTGYGGLTAEIIGVEGEGTNMDRVDTFNDGLIAEWDQWSDGGQLAWFGNPTGVTMEIQGRANIMGTEETGEPIIEVIDNEDGTFTQKTWRQYIVKCEIGVMVTTSGNGLDGASNTVFTIMLQENQFDLFTAADATLAYIIEAYVVDVTDDTPMMKVNPASGGMYVGLTSLGYTPAPQWIMDGGYQEPLSTMSKASFNLKVDWAQPTSFWGGSRAEVSATWIIGIDMLTFGYWEKVGPNKNFDPPTDDWLSSILQALPAMIIVGALIGTILVVLVIVSRFWIMTKMTTASSK